MSQDCDAPVNIGSTSKFTESVVEEAALDWLKTLGYSLLHGPEIAAGEQVAERSDPNYRDVILDGRLHQALARLNPDLPPEALEDAYRKLSKVDAPSLIERNRALHRTLGDGVTVEYRRKDGSIAGAQARVIDFDDADGNDWLAVNQFTVAEGQHTRRPDVVLFVNGLPLAVHPIQLNGSPISAARHAERRWRIVFVMLETTSIS
jgi:type I restriction enzyme R subunit